MAAACGTLGYIFRLRLDAVTELQRQTQLAREDAARVREQFAAIREKWLPLLKNPSLIQVSISTAAAQ